MTNIKGVSHEFKKNNEKLTDIIPPLTIYRPVRHNIIVKHIIAILIVSIYLCPCFTQSVDDKNYRLSFITAFDYSFNIYPITVSFIYLTKPPEMPVNITMTSVGKPAFGEGIRLEYKFKDKIGYTISAMMLDKGFGIIQKDYINSKLNAKYYDIYSRVYISIPIEVIYKMGKIETPTYIKSGFSCDLNYHRSANHKPIVSSLIFGVGKTFCINEILWISIEPTFRYALLNYGQHLQIISDRFDNYRPVSVGFMVSLSQ